MADERLEVLLKARIDPTSQKDLQVQATAVGEKLEPIDLDIRIDTKKAIQSFSELKKVMKEVTSLAKQNEDGILGDAVDIQTIEKFKNAFGKTVTIIDQLIQKTDEFGNQTNEVATEITKNNTSLEKQNQLIDKASKLQTELNLARQKFDITGQADLYKLGDNLDLNGVENLRSRFKNIDINPDGSNLDEVLNNIKSINKEYDLIIKDANLNKKINDDVTKQKEKELKLYQEIKTILDKLPSSAVGTNDTQDLYTLLDSTTEIKDLQALKDIAKQYYNESITSEKELTNAQKLRSQDIKETFNDYKRIQDISTKVDTGLSNLNSIKTSYSGANVQDFERLENAWKDIRTQIQNGTIDYEEANNSIKKLTNSNKDFETSAKKASIATNSLGDRLKKAFQYFTFYDALQMGKRAVESMVETIFDLDNALVDLRKVSDLSGQSLQDFTRQAYNLGTEISKSGSEVIKASTAFAKAGFADSELLNLAESALVLTSIGDDLTDASESAETLISVMKGFGKSTSEIPEIMDAINNVSNNASVNFSDVTMALQRMAGVMNASNITMERSIGMFTAINEVLRNTEMTSTSLNSISMRMRGLSEDGEAIDGLVPKLQKMYKTIAGIDMTDTNGQLKNMYDIAGELAPKWDTLTENQKQFIASESAGLRQSKSFLIMMDNYDRVLEATALAYDSAGSAQQEFVKWQDSLEGRMNNLKSSIEQFASETINSSFVKAIISATTEVVKFGTAVGGAVPVIVSLGLAFLAFQKGSLVSSLFTSIITQIKILTTVSIGAVGAVTALQMALGVGFVVAGILGVSYAINSISERANKAKESISTLSGELEDLKSNKATIETLGTQYIDLKVNEDNLNNEQLNEYYDVQNKIKELMPEISGFYNEQGNFIIENVNSLTDLTSIQKDYIKLKREELALASKDNMSNTVNSYEKENKNLDYLQGLKDIGMLSKKGEEELKETADKVKQYTTDMSDSILQVVVSTQNWANLTEDEANAIRKAYTELSADKKQDYAKQIKDNTFNTQEFLNTLSEYPSYIEYMENATQNAITANNELASSFDSVEESVKKLSTTRSDIESLQKVFNSLSEGNTLSASDMEELLSISEEFIPYLNDEIALREKLGKTITDYKDTYQENYNKMLQSSTSYYDEKIRGDTELHKTLTSNLEKYFNNMGLAYEDNLDDYTTLENAKANISTQIIKQVAGNWSKYFSSTGDLIEELIPSMKGNKINSMVLGGRASEDMDKLFAQGLNYKESEIQRLIAESNKIADSIIFEPINLDFDTSSLKSSTDKAISEIDRLKQELESRLSDKEFEISLLEFSGGEDSAQKQITIYQQMQDEVHTLAQKYRAMGLSENDDYIQQLRTQWMDYANTISSLEATSFDNSNKDIDRNITQLELQQQLLKENSQEYIDIENKKYDEIVKREQLLQTEIARLQAIGTAQAKDQAESLIDTYYDTVSQRYSIIANLQSSQISIYNEQIESLEKQKSALEDLHDFTMQMIKDELNAKKKSIQSEIDGIEKVFNAKKQALKDEQDSRSYDKGLTEKSSLVADLENQLALIKNDETAIAKRKALEQELADAKEDLADYQYDHSIELAEKALDEELEIQKSKLEEEIEELDDTLSNEVTMRELANKRIEKSGERLKNQLIAHAKEYGTFTIEEVTNAWEIAGEAVDDFNLKQLDLLDTLGLVADKLKEVQADLKRVENQSVSDYGNSIGASTSYKKSDAEKHAQMVANSKAWTSASSDKKIDLELENQKLGKELGYEYNPSEGVWYRYVNGKKIRAYHKGGVVGGLGYATKSTEELAKLLKGELVVTPPQADKVMDMITNNSNSNINISMPIIIEGNADSDTVKSLEKQVGKIADTVIEKLTTARNNTGFKKKPKFV